MRYFPLPRIRLPSRFLPDLFMQPPRQTIALAFLALCFVGGACAEDEIEFNRDIRPILSNRCYTCHGPDEATREAELRLDAVRVAIVTED